MKNFSSFVILLILFSVNIFGQRSNSKSSFISLFVGDLSILSENFVDVYQDKNDLTFGLGVGIPISTKISIDVSASYFNKKFINDNEILTIDFKKAEIKQLIFNAGFQYHLLPKKIIGLTLLLGANYSMVDEEWVNDVNEFIYEYESEGNFGFYGGANLELNLGYSPVALFSEVKYTYSAKPVIEYLDTYREIKFLGGLKVYLADRWH